MKRFDAINRIVEILTEEYVVCNIGMPSKELYHLRDRPQNFYMMGSMGLASSIALGLAISQPEKKIWCIDGDGSILMNLGSLSTIANVNPSNLTLIVIDNESYGSTGDQCTYTYNKTKLDVIAEGAGFKSIVKITKVEEIKNILRDLGKGCHFVLIKTKPGSALVSNIPLKPIEIKNRFMQSITEN
ncbi:MAG: sulfopyruvate decarboxylase subunit beta [Candidatus Odinarchaeota archaeon]